MRTATLADVDLIKSILLVPFKNNPYLTWLLEKSKNKFKLNVLINYVVHQTLRRGEIYLTDDNNAVGLWDFERSLGFVDKSMAQPEDRRHRNYQSECREEKHGSGF